MKLFLAPIQGMTIGNFRNHYDKIFGGIDGYYAPFITTTNSSKFSPALLKDILPEYNNQSIQVIPQLLGNNGEDFRYYSSHIADLGYQEINWNIGCPFPTVTKKKRGSGLLPYPDMIKAFLDIACADRAYTLSVKMRLGLEHVDEGLEVIKILNDYPLTGVTIHGRTGKQMYTGHVDLDGFASLYTACNHQVTYNGDIFSYADFENIHLRFPDIENFMLGRGPLWDPFLPSAIKGEIIGNNKKIDMIKEFHDRIYAYYKEILSGDKHLCDRMKEFWSYMSKHIDSNGKYMKKIKKSNNSTTYLAVVGDMLGGSSMWHDSI